MHGSSSDTFAVAAEIVRCRCRHRSSSGRFRSCLGHSGTPALNVTVDATFACHLRFAVARFASVMLLFEASIVSAAPVLCLCVLHWPAAA